MGSGNSNGPGVGRLDWCSGMYAGDGEQEYEGR